MQNRKCFKHFPKEFQEETVIDENGITLYKRRDNGRHVFKNGKWLNYRWVVPYNMAMFKKYHGQYECRVVQRNTSDKVVLIFQNVMDLGTFSPI